MLNILNFNRGENADQKNSNSIDKKCTPLIADQAYCDASLPSKSFSDNSYTINTMFSAHDPINQPGGILLSSNEIQVKYLCIIMYQMLILMLKQIFNFSIKYLNYFIV